MQPYDYRTQVASPFEASIQGLQLGQGLADMQVKRQQIAMEQQANQQKIEQQRAAQQAAQSFYAKPNKTTDDFLAFSQYLPADKIKPMLEMMQTGDTKKAQSLMGFAGQVAVAARNSPELAVNMLAERAKAYENSGDTQNAQALSTLGKLIEINPNQAVDSVLATMAVLPGGKDVIDSVIKAQQAPSQLVKSEADAKTAGVTAKFSESQAMADLEKKGWDIAKLKADIDVNKQNARIAAMNAATSREGNTLKKQELLLKIGEAKQKRDEGVKTKVAELENARFNIDNLLNTADRIIATPKDIVGSASGPISARMPTLSQDTADFEALISNLDSQAFLSQIPQMKGTGALSENEGKKLAASLQNLSLSQSPEQLIGNVKEVQRLMIKARKTLADKYGMPESAPDTPAAPSASKSSGKTTDQILKELGVM